VSVSLVIPVHNEAGNLLPLVTAAVEVLQALGRDYEIIIVNDGSTDGTPAEIAALHAHWPQCRELTMPARAGQAAALLAGLGAAKGDLVITMDGDGQNDPRDIPPLLGLVGSGTLDMACGWRVDRHDAWIRRVMSRVANAVRSVVLGDGLRDAGCQLRVFRREVCEAIESMELLQSFLPALAVAAGFRVGEHPVRHHPRRYGESKYGLGRLWWRPAVAMVALRWRLWRRRRKHVSRPA
jgi:glycosyltransferase involved in cell wall biosynthesis